MALKLRANFSNLVAILRKCFNLAKRFSIRCLILYKCESKVEFVFMLLRRLGITGFIPALTILLRTTSESYPLSAIKYSASSTQSIVLQLCSRGLHPQ